MQDRAIASIPDSCDVLVIGGGINGAGIARDLAGRGLRVVLCEQGDLAQATSSASTKLIHGGLRYLEHGEFSLVRKALAEREVLLRAAPHLLRPLRFVMPHAQGLRPAALVRLGLFLYDHLARRELLPPSGAIDLRRHPAGAPLKPGFRRGFVYSDGWADDARLVVANALDAQARGAAVLTRCRCVQARRTGTGWQAELARADAPALTVAARAVVNAAGPWAARCLQEVAGLPATHTLRLVKGSHIVVPALFGHDHAYIFQNPDRRIIFALPYEERFTLIGTTDVEHAGPVEDVRIDAAEIAYLCEQAGRYFAAPVRPADVVWSYSGVRPLLEDESGDPSAVTRDYRLELDAAGPPLLTVWGGKLTTFRKLAEEAADRLAAALPGPPARGAWTRGAVLPGGEFARGRRPDEARVAFESALAARLPQLDAATVRRLCRAYGSRVERLLAHAAAPGDLGAEVAPGLHEAELRYLQSEEWARTAEDVLWRRSKLGLHYTPAQRESVARWIAHSAGAPT